jgi:queuosine precursor transporter
MSNIGLISAALYASFQVISNILSTKITILPLLKLSMDGGTVIYPLTFTLRDFVHKTCGKKNSRIVVITAGCISLIAIALLWIVGKMPADPAWSFQKDYENILMPVLRITLASIVAQIVSELIDTEIFSYLYKKINDISGSFFSNFCALIADSLIFCSIAFLGVLPFVTVIKILGSNLILKFIISIVSVPTIKLIPRTVDENLI